MLTVKRDKGLADKIRTYRIVLDGVAVGSVGDGEVLRTPISEGAHVIEAKIDWCGSQPLEFSAGPGDATVVVYSALRGWRLLLGFYYAFFNRRGYLRLALADHPAA